MTAKGQKQINKIMSVANTKGFYYKPRIDLNCLLSLDPDDVVVTTACVAGRMFKEDWYEKFFVPVHDHFKDHFFLEVQAHVHPVQTEYNKKIMAVSRKYGVPIIHANDSHYISEEDAQFRDLFLKAKGIYYEEEDGFVLDYPDSSIILERYKKQGVLTEDEAVKALQNTLIFDNAESVYTDKEFKIPCISKDILMRELNITEEDTADKNKILQIIVKRAWQREKQKTREAVRRYGAVLTRSGRGSAVSFYINKLLGLTEVDRLKAPITLYPTRFMSAERILSSRSLPDIDLNFASVEPVVRASKDILGDAGIYYMVAYKPLQESSAFRLWCKANGYNINEYDDIAKNLDDYSDDKRWGHIINDSKVFRGVIESIAPSPCSFLLLDKPISDEVGLVKVGDVVCCALDGYNCDCYKYLKND